MNIFIKKLVESFIDNEEELSDINLDFNREQYVDLGLSSGTKWAKCNLGATAPEESGLYYQWGISSGYEFGMFDFNHEYFHDYFEQNNMSGDEVYDNNDAVFIKTNGFAKTPTKEQLQELITECKYTWTALNGVNGGEFIGPNGNSIFIPAAGYCIESEKCETNFEIDLWTRSANKIYNRIKFRLRGLQDRPYLASCSGYYGFPLRAVYV